MKETDTNNSQLSTLNSTLPKGWEIKKLGEVCEVQRGLTYSGKDAVDYSDIIVLRATNINLENSSLDFSELKYLRSDFKIQEKYKLKKGSLLICFSSGSKSHLGKVALVDDDYNYAFGGFIGQIKPNQEINSKYLFYSLISEKYKQYISELTDGVNINNLKIKDLQNFQIPIPPLPEQKRIVSFLDRAFEAIDQAKANAGKNLQNAKELFESYLQGVFENNNWGNIIIEEIAKVIGGYSFKSKDFKKGGKYQVIRMGNVRPGLIRENESPVFLDELDDKVLQRALLKKNDVIITQTGTKKKRDYGFTVIINKDNFLLNQRISSIRFKGDYLPEFFLFYSWTNFFKDQYFANETGTVGQGNVGIKAILEAEIPYPKIKIQQKIVNNIKSFLFETQKVEVVYQKKIDNLEEMKKSVLQKAFNGELTGKEIAV